MNPARLQRVTFWFCLASALAGLLITMGYTAFLVPVACCDETFLFITGRFAADFIVAPLLAGLSLQAYGWPGRMLFWSSCAWMTVATWPPFLILLAALCIWTRVRVRDESVGAQPVA